MEAGSEKLLESEPPQSRFDWLIQWLMAALLAFMPFALGAVSRWAEEIVFIISGAMVICLLLKLIVRPNERFIWSWAYVPLGLFLLLVAFQLIPMPAGILAAITPSTVAIKTSLLSGLSEGTRTNPAMTVSFYSLPTERALRLALAVAGVFVVTVNVCRRDSQIQRLLATVVVIGAAAALLALAQRATNTQKIYWRIPARTMAGPFVNRNNYCQFMNLSVGAAIGLLLFRIKTAFRGTPVVLSRVVERLGVRELKPAWWLSGMIVLALASIFLSLSRGGMISLLIAWGATIAVLALKRRLQASGWIMCILAAGAFACVLYVSFDSIYERFASLGRLQEYGGRWQLLRDSTRAWSTFPLFGAGLGLHEYIHPMFDNSTILAAASHAENEYVQMAEETGIVGLLLIGAFGAVILRSYIRCLRHKRGSAGLLAVGLSAGLLAVIVHKRLRTAPACQSVSCGGLLRPAGDYRSSG